MGPFLVLFLPSFLLFWWATSWQTFLLLFLAGAFLVLDILWAIWLVLDWGNDYYIVTSQRVVWLEKVIAVYDSRQESPLNTILAVAVETSLLLLSPIVPHLAEELWARLEKPGTAQGRSWPAWDARFLSEEERELVIQVNGKVRSRLSVKVGATEAEIKEQALAQPRIQEWLAGKEVVKIIVVQQKLVNIVLR